MSTPDKPFESPSQLLDPKEQRRKRDRDRYARMTDQEKQEKLKKRREAYHQQKRTSTNSTQIQKKCSQVTDQEKQQKLQKKCMHERERYANMQPNQKKAKLEQDSANRARRRDTLSKNSIAMENPANRNEKFTARTMEKTPAPPDEDCYTNTKVIDDLESTKQPTNMKEAKDGEEPNQSFIDDEQYGDDGAVYEEDTDEEDNIISGQE